MVGIRFQHELCSINVKGNLTGAQFHGKLSQNIPFQAKFTRFLGEQAKVGHLCTGRILGECRQSSAGRQFWFIAPRGFLLEISICFGFIGAGVNFDEVIYRLMSVMRFWRPVFGGEGKLRTKLRYGIPKCCLICLTGDGCRNLFKRDSRMQQAANGTIAINCLRARPCYKIAFQSKTSSLSSKYAYFVQFYYFANENAVQPCDD